MHADSGLKLPEWTAVRVDWGYFALMKFRRRREAFFFRFYFGSHFREKAAVAWLLYKLFLGYFHSLGLCSDFWRKSSKPDRSVSFWFFHHRLLSNWCLRRLPAYYCYGWNFTVPALRRADAWAFTHQRNIKRHDADGGRGRSASEYGQSTRRGWWWSRSWPSEAETPVSFYSPTILQINSSGKNRLFRLLV